MPSPTTVCVQSVNNLWMTHRTTGVRQSTVMHSHVVVALVGWAQHQLIATLTHISSPESSTGIIAASPLVEHYLYPVSTAPITSTTN